MGKDDFYKSGESEENFDEQFPADLFQNDFDSSEQSSPSYGEDDTREFTFDPDDLWQDENPESEEYDFSDTYQDSGEYRTYDGSREYRSFDAELPEASSEEWYAYAEADRELDEDEFIPEEPERCRRRKRRHPIRSGILHGLLVFCTIISIFYLVAVYSEIPWISSMRTMYIEAAMTSLSHKWLATALIPGDVISDVMRLQYEAEDASVGIESNWGMDTQELPSFSSGSVTDADISDETADDDTVLNYSSSSAGLESTDMDSDEAIFYEMFWEIDRDSFNDYLEEHPETLDNGWAGIDINEAGLNDSGTSIQTIYGDQVLAINAVDGVMLARVYLSSNNSRGVLAICKDTSRVSLCAADTLGTIGQVAGKIADANNGVLAINGSAFDDPEGNGNGGEIQGIAVCSGVVYGSRLGSGYKRLELRTDNKMYIVDSNSSIAENTRDAAEFQPALIVDGETMDYGVYTGPNPRAAMGQTSRLETIMLVVEGRFSDSLGCSVEYVAEKMLQYGCVQAINLDGGTSAIMYYKGEYITRCSNTNLPSGRTLPTAWVYACAD